MLTGSQPKKCKMNVLTQLALVDAYQSFMSTANPFLNIVDESGYSSTLETLEQLIETAQDSEDEPLNLLIDLLSSAIEKFLGFYKAYPQDTQYVSKSVFYIVRDWFRRTSGVRAIAGYGDNAQIELHHSVIMRMLADPTEIDNRKNVIKYPRLTLYRPNNVLDFLNRQDNPVQYCLDLWLRQKGRLPSDTTIEKLQQLLVTK